MKGVNVSDLLNYSDGGEANEMRKENKPSDKTGAKRELF